jgi:Tectonin domain
MKNALISALIVTLPFIYLTHRLDKTSSNPNQQTTQSDYAHQSAQKQMNNAGKKRKITVDEYHFALSLFPRDFPMRDEITITDDVSPANGAYFVRPTIGALVGEGNIQMNMGGFYDDCLKNKALFAHELTHVWQIRHFGVPWYTKEFLENHVFCIGDGYAVTCVATKKFGDYNAEQQGVIMSRSYTTNDACIDGAVNRAFASDTWKLMIGSAGRDIAVSENGTLYLTNSVGTLYKYNGKEWIQLPGSDGVSIAANGKRVIFTNTVGKIYEFAQDRWTQLAGSDAVDIAIDNNGEAWMVNTAGKIYKLVGGTWKQMAGSSGKRIAAGGGQVWMVNSVGKVYNFNKNTSKWVEVTGVVGRDITVSNSGKVFATNTAGSILQRSGSNWTTLDGSDGNTVSANEGNLILLNTTGRIYNRKF